MKVLCIGEEWRGSNSSGLFYALSRIGVLVNLVNEQTFVSANGKSFQVKALNKLIRTFQINDFNNYLISITKKTKPDWVLVYKGAYLKPETISFWKKMKLPVINFFPDVSFTAHGKYIPQCVPLFDFIFTTKTFAASDLNKNFNYPKEKVSFLPHGFDPMIHRPVTPSTACDASFIGNFSLRKFEYLKYLMENYPKINLVIWGSTWFKSQKSVLDHAIQYVPILGDAYADAIGGSKINIALLSEQVIGASSGDQITSRTFHITGAGGFMLHQRTDEVQQYFVEGEEMACFDTREELVEKIEFYLANPLERERIRMNGYKRAMKDHSLDKRALSLISILKNNKIINNFKIGDKNEPNL